MSMYKVWLGPQPDMARDLDELIAHLSGRARTRPFPAHITLIDETDVDVGRLCDMLREVAGKATTLTFHFKRYVHTDAWDAIVAVLYPSKAGNHFMRLVSSYQYDTVPGEYPAIWYPIMTLVHGEVDPVTRIHVLGHYAQMIRPFSAGSLEIVAADEPLHTVRPLFTFPIPRP